MRTLIIAAAVAWASVADAVQIVAPGFSMNVLGPTLPGGSTTSTVAAVDPTTNNIWMSNGQTIFMLDGLGQVASSENLSFLNTVTTDLAFDAAGGAYVVDFFAGTIFKRPLAGLWAPWTTITFPRAFAFEPGGDMIVLSSDGNADQPGTAWRVAPDGTSTQFGVTNWSESFVLDPNTGDMLIPHYLGTGIDRMTMAGVNSTIFSWARDDVALYESIALTDGGNIFVGVHKNDSNEVEYDEIIRINGITGLRELIVQDADQVPADMLLAGDLLVAGFGSLVPLSLSGDLDTVFPPTEIPIPEPSTGLLVVLGLAALRLRRPLRRV